MAEEQEQYLSDKEMVDKIEQEVAASIQSATTAREKEVAEALKSADKTLVKARVFVERLDRVARVLDTYNQSLLSESQKSNGKSK